VHERADPLALHGAQDVPALIRLKTRIGMLLSMQSDIAVASMTWSCRFSTSM
jgi:hypothetical protein